MGLGRRRRGDGTQRSGGAQGRLVQLLAEAGIEFRAPRAPDVQTTWTVLAAFAQETVSDRKLAPVDGDLMLAQFGTYDTGDGETFNLNMTRQFYFLDRRGEFHHLTHLSCTFEYDATTALRALGQGNLWSTEMSLPVFFDSAGSLPGFSFAREHQLDPKVLRITYEWV